MTLDHTAIAERITDCLTYKFGLRNADKLAHEDAPTMLSALYRTQGFVEQTIYANEDNDDSVVWRNAEVLELLQDVLVRLQALEPADV